MSKEELINCICQINRSAQREFLESFTEEDLDEYLEHLLSLDLAEVGAGV
jgi:HSP90 family molecular chaperone